MKIVSLMKVLWVTAKGQRINKRDQNSLKGGSKIKISPVKKRPVVYQVGSAPRPPTADGSPLHRVRWRYLRRGRRRAALLPASRHRAHVLRTTSREAAAVGIPTMPPPTLVLPAAAATQSSAAADISSQRQVHLQEAARPPGCISCTRGRRIAPSSADNSRDRFLRLAAGWKRKLLSIRLH